MFNNNQLLEFLAVLKNFSIAINGTGTMSVGGRINCIIVMLRGGALREFELSSQNNGTTNAHLKHIVEGLIRCFYPIKSIFKQKRAMCHAMCKPRDLPLNLFTAQLTELNNYLPLFPPKISTRFYYTLFLTYRQSKPI